MYNSGQSHVNDLDFAGIRKGRHLMQKILIIEDEKEIRHLYNELLGTAYDLEFAINGQEGYKQATKGNFDLIITDLKMPYMDGAEAISSIDFLKKNQKFLVVSGYLDNTEYLEKIEDIPNVMATLSKPFHTDELWTAVRESIEKTIPST